MIDAGVILFVYRRPEHTREVLANLRENDLEKLYVFADGPGADDDPEQIRATRNLIDDIDWCETDVTTFDRNHGLRQTWVAGFDHVLDRHEAIIALEDDCVPAPQFVEFMRRCLTRYRNEERVMNVHGYCPPIDIPDDYPYDVFFTRRSGSWGQGTWREAWDKLVRDRDDLAALLDSAPRRRTLAQAGGDLLPMAEGQVRGELDSIGIYWSWTLAKHDALSVNAVDSYVKNIGHDGTGTHSSPSEKFEIDLIDRRSALELEFPPSVTVTRPLNSRYIEYQQPTLAERFEAKVKKTGARTLRKLGLY